MKYLLLLIMTGFGLAPGANSGEYHIDRSGKNLVQFISDLPLGVTPVIP